MQHPDAIPSSAARGIAQSPNKAQRRTAGSAPAYHPIADHLYAYVLWQVDRRQPQQRIL